MSFFNRLRLSAGVNAGIIILVGLMFLVNPVGSSRLIITMAGVALLLSGIGDIIHFATGNDYYDFVKGSLVMGIIKALLGYYAMSHTYALLSLFSTVVAIFVLVCGINSMENALRLRQGDVLGWQVNAVVAVLVIIYAVTLLLRPFGAAHAAMSLIGWVLLAVGVCDFFAVNRMSNLF